LARPPKPNAEPAPGAAYARPEAAMLPVRTHLGEMPELWSGSAVFFADLYAIFYGEPEKTRQLEENVSGFFGYGGRLISMLGLLYGGPDNLLILQEPVEPELPRYFSERLGLKVPSIEVLDHRNYDTFYEGLAANPALVEHLARHPARLLDGYVTDPPLEEIAARLGKELINTYAQSRDANDKILLHRFLAQRRLPMFDGGEMAVGPELDGCLRELAGMGYRKAVVRSSLGASGFGVQTVPLNPGATGRDLPKFLLAEGRLLVQGWIEPEVRGVTRVTSPSLQFFCGDAGHSVFDLTGQLLRNASIHEGNVSPPADLPGGPAAIEAIISQGTEVVRWVAGTGYRGTGSIDFLVYDRDGGAEVVVCEVNARVTGATYPSLLARRFRPGRAWLMRNFAFVPELTGAEVLARMDEAGMLFLKERDEGVLPINFIRDEEGRVAKAQLLFLAETPERCMDMIVTCMGLLPTRRRYERD
jgi:hypothetical protein